MKLERLQHDEAEEILSSYFMQALKETGLRSFPLFKATKVVLIRKGHEPAGVLLYRCLDKDLVEIDFIAVRESFKRQGLASALMKSLETSRFWLEVSKKNLAAVAFYKGLGFKEVGVRPNYYSDGTAALSLKKEG